MIGAERGSSGVDGGSGVTAQESRSREDPIRSILVHEAWLPSAHPLHRPRHGRRQLTALIAAVVFFVPPVLVSLLGARPAEFENRRLTAAPSPSDGWRFFTALPAWAADRLPFRDIAVRAADDVSRGVFGEAFPLDRAPSRGTLSGELPAPAAPGPAGPPVAAPSSPPVPGGYPPVIEGDEGWLYYGFDVQAKCDPLHPLDRTVDAVNRLRAAVEASGRRFVLVVVPDKSTVQPEYLPQDYPGRDCARAGTRAFWAQLVGRAGAVDLRSDLAGLSAREGPVYHRLDSHWTDRGALLMTAVLAERVQPGSTRTWQVQPGEVVRSRADLPPLIGRTGVSEHEQYLLAPAGGRARTGPSLEDLREPVLIGSGEMPGVVTASVTLLADSFSQQAARYLTAAFADMAVVSYETAGRDPARIGDLLADRDVVVLEAVERNLAAGMVPVLDPAALDAISAALAARPRG